ncbi:Ldh family oxidoreductase [Isosphaeraceae bacterium EP7]
MSKDEARFSLDGLRRFATDLAECSGVPPAHAAGLVSHLLWFDSAGAGRFGVSTLVDWLERAEQGRVNVDARGRFLGEQAATGVFDGQNGLPPLILSRAAEVAGEKAREVGMGLVRVVNLGPAGPAAGVAAELAVGPTIAVVLGPGPSWTMALPAGEGLPAVFDSALAHKDGEEGGAPDWLGPIAPWIGALVPDGGWLVLALSVHAIEDLGALHGRVGGAGLSSKAPGRLAPAAWEASRRLVRERGVVVEANALERLADLATRRGLALPERLSG